MRLHARALGRLLKTVHVLRYLHDGLLRGRVQLQLNRGESRHDLARRLFFANRGVFRSGDYAEIMNKVSALSVLSNAVLVWNTVRIGAIVDELEAGGQPVSRDDLARVSPLLDAHVIATGSYNFDRAVRRARPQENQGAVAESKSPRGCRCYPGLAPRAERAKGLASALPPRIDPPRRLSMNSSGRRVRRRGTPPSSER